MKTANALLGYRLHPFIAVSYGTAANSVLHLPAAHPLPIKVKKDSPLALKVPFYSTCRHPSVSQHFLCSVIKGIHDKSAPVPQRIPS